MIQVTPFILCGGSGTRLWPLSRTGLPKQFLCITGNESLFQQAELRLVTLGLDFSVSPTFTATVKFWPTQQQQSAAASISASLGGLGGFVGAPADLISPADQVFSQAQEARF